MTDATALVGIVSAVTTVFGVIYVARSGKKVGDKQSEVERLQIQNEARTKDLEAFQATRESIESDLVRIKTDINDERDRTRKLGRLLSLALTQIRIDRYAVRHGQELPPLNDELAEAAFDPLD